eukprot:TRINITY_DN15904_c0_g1_i1.p1 TRINITY_DN15904_c0_g1~~TRINITY_DN15904_c0_g1_i1.p1  ORF type:complete len:348 (+),score=62.55 TRINITY_DN15904_c0_g1_i1:332-1375(+)
MSLYVLFIVEIERYLKGSSKLIREVLLKHETDDEEFLPKNVRRGEVMTDSQLLDLLDINKTSLRVTIAELFNSYMRSMVGTICTFVNLCSDRREALRVITREIDFEQKLIETLTQKSRQLAEKRSDDNKVRTLQLQSEVVRLEETIEEMQQSITQLRDGHQIPASTPAVETDSNCQVVATKRFIIALHIDGIYKLSEIESVRTHVPWIIHSLFLMVKNVLANARTKDSQIQSRMFTQCSHLVTVGSVKAVETIICSLNESLVNHPWPEELTSITGFSKGPKLRAAIHFTVDTIGSKEVARTISLIPVTPNGKCLCSLPAATQLSSTGLFRKVHAVSANPIDTSFFWK